MKNKNKIKLKMNTTPVVETERETIEPDDTDDNLKTTEKWVFGIIKRGRPSPAL